MEIIMVIINIIQPSSRLKVQNKAFFKKIHKKCKKKLIYSCISDLIWLYLHKKYVFCM